MRTQPDTNNNRLTKLIPRVRAAFYLGCCTRTVKRLEQRGLLTAHRLNSRVIAYPEAEIVKLVSEARVASVEAVAR